MSTVMTAGAWKVRHEGSPRSVDNLTLAKVVEGLQDGQWEPTDEVMGPGDANWVAIENHPELADIAMELEPPPPRTYDDETRLDMNALIDVCLVLLIFFMLITTYSVLQARIEQGRVQDDQKAKVVKREQVEQQMLFVKVHLDANKEPVILLEDKQIAADDLKAAFVRAVQGTTKTELLLQADDDVPHGVVVAIQDAASGARLNAVHLVMPAKK